MPTTERPDLESTICLLAERWAGAEPLLPAFSLLARGRPLDVNEIARAAGVPLHRVIGALEAGRCEHDDGGRLVELYGLSLLPTLHRLTIDGKVLFSCCAIWAHVIPGLVGRTLQIESIDPIRRTLVRLLVSPTRVESVEPAGAVATVAVATREAVEADVGRAFCRKVLHFVSRESAETFAAETPDAHAVDLTELRASAELLRRSIWRVL